MNQCAAEKSNGDTIRGECPDPSWVEQELLKIVKIPGYTTRWIPDGAAPAPKRDEPKTVRRMLCDYRHEPQAILDEVTLGRATVELIHYGPSQLSGKVVAVILAAAAYNELLALRAKVLELARAVAPG